MVLVEASLGPSALRLLRAAASKAAKAVRFKLGKPSLAGHAPNISGGSRIVRRQPLQPAARLRQQQRWLSDAAIQHVNNALRRFTTSGRGASSRFDRPRLSASSNTARRIATCGRRPFASTLRPNLTGGAMPRSAGGYSLGGSARHFSHTPVAPAQVVQNVSQAVRAFFLSGQKLKYDGIGPQGQAMYRAVSEAEDKTMRQMANAARFAPGSFIDFRLSPTITALGPLAAAVTRASDVSPSCFHTEPLCSLNTEGFLDVLSADFGQALKDLGAIYGDLKRLAVLGDLPISLDKDSLRVRFPGVDASLVSRLCDDVGIQRGIVGQDASYDSSAAVAMALKFPFASDAEQTTMTFRVSARSFEGHELDDKSSFECDAFVCDAFQVISEEQHWPSDPEGYESMSSLQSSRANRSFEGLEAIYRFLEECDRSKGRLG